MESALLEYFIFEVPKQGNRWRLAFGSFDPTFNSHFLFLFLRLGGCSFGMKSDSPAGEGVGVRLLDEMGE